MKIVLSESQFRVLVEKYKIADDERIKLYETEDFLLVIPLTYTASCKYGANTKWCVTEKDDDEMFQRHDKIAGLGFLIVKNPSLQEKFNNSKFAFYINKPKSVSAARDPERVIVYDDLADIIPMRIFLNQVDEAGVYNEVKKALNKFMMYTIEKFSEQVPKISNK